MVDRDDRAAGPSPRRAALAVVIGLAIVTLAGQVAGPTPAHGQTAPRRPTPATNQPSVPVVNPPPGVPVVTANVVVSAPPAGGAREPAPAPEAGAAGAPPALPAGGAQPPAQPGGATASGPTAPGGAGPALPAAVPGQPAGVSGPGGAAAAPPAGPSAGPALADPASASGPALAPLAPPPLASVGGRLVTGLVAPAAGGGEGGVAIVSTGVGSPLRLTILVPQRSDSATSVEIGLPAASEVAAIVLPGVVVARAFTVNVARPDGSLLSQHPRPLTLALPLEDADVALAGGDPDRLRLMRWDPARSVAIVLPTTIDRRARTIVAPTDHTSLFLLAAAPPGASGEIGARAAPAWGTEAPPTGPVPVRMPRVGGWAGPAPFATAALLGLFAAAALPRLARPRPSRRQRAGEPADGSSAAAR